MAKKSELSATIRLTNCFVGSIEESGSTHEFESCCLGFYFEWPNRCIPENEIWDVIAIGNAFGPFIFEMRWRTKHCSENLRLSLLIITLFTQYTIAEPPYTGTIFIDPDIITEDDPSLFDRAEVAGEGERLVFDRRINAWININMRLIRVFYITGQVVEARVNLEFDAATARELAEWYATIVGRIPLAFMRDVDSITIHAGVRPFGGGNRNLLIHHGQGELYSTDGILEEVFVHEAAHTSLDADHSADADWLKAQEADGEFISNYAKNFPGREDIAESVLVFLAVEYRSERISEALLDTIIATIPNRIDYFRNQRLNWYPIDSSNDFEGLAIAHSATGLTLSWPVSVLADRQLMESTDAVQWRLYEGEIESLDGQNRVRLKFDEQRRRLFRLEEAANQAGSTQ